MSVEKRSGVRADRKENPAIAWLGIILLAIGLSACSSDDEEDSVSEDLQYSAIYVFGDSLSDTGNLGNYVTLGLDLPAPFFDNRITNGRVAVEYIAERFDLPVEASLFTLNQSGGTNYAVAGAQATEAGNVDLEVEISAFRLRVSNDAPSDALYIVFIGGNDILAARGINPPLNQQLLDAAVAAEVSGIETLYEIGARQFVVMTVPDIGRTPRVLLEGQTDPAAPSTATALTQYYNNALRLAIDEADLSDAQVTMIDTFAIGRDLLETAGDFDITNTTDACYNSDIGSLGFNPGCSEAQLDSYFYFDDIHPSARVHQLIGERAAEVVPERQN